MNLRFLGGQISIMSITIKNIYSQFWSLIDIVQNIKSSKWAHTHLTHLEVLHHCEVGEDYAEDHCEVPDLVAVAADVVATWVVALGAAG